MTCFPPPLPPRLVWPVRLTGRQLTVKNQRVSFHCPNIGYLNDAGQWSPNSHFFGNICRFSNNGMKSQTCSFWAMMEARLGWLLMDFLAKTEVRESWQWGWKEWKDKSGCGVFSPCCSLLKHSNKKTGFRLCKQRQFFYPYVFVFRLCIRLRESLLYRPYSFATSDTRLVTEPFDPITNAPPIGVTSSHHPSTASWHAYHA